MEEVAYLADRVYVMATGTDVLSGTPVEIFTDKEKLQRYQIGTPETVQALYRLKDLGYNVDTSAFTVSEAADEIIKVLTNGEVENHGK
jgi:energy-coupling factor transport system ATP-binding protein